MTQRSNPPAMNEGIEVNRNARRNKHITDIAPESEPPLRVAESAGFRRIRSALSRYPTIENDPHRGLQQVPLRRTQPKWGQSPILKRS